MTVQTLTRTQRDTLDSLLTPEIMGKLERTCRRRCHGTLDPDDIMQMTLMRAALSMDTWKGGNFQAWIMRIMHTVWANEITRRKRHHEDEQTALPNPFDEGTGDVEMRGYNLEDHVIGLDLSPQMKHALSALNSKQRAALVLHAYGYKHTEITQILGLGGQTLGSSSTLVSRAKRKARTALVAV